jgi:hypothetical protein
VGLKSLKSLNLTNGYPNKNNNKNKNKNNNNKVKSKPLELFELAGKNFKFWSLMESDGWVDICQFLNILVSIWILHKLPNIKY